MQSHAQQTHKIFVRFAIAPKKQRRTNKKKTRKDKNKKYQQKTPEPEL